MLNSNKERELAYVVLVDGIEPIPGYDRVEAAIVGGWHVIVQKDQFHVGEPAIYFEIDSKVPSDRECFAFLEKRHYKVKTLKMCKTISQGLLMHANDFGWENVWDEENKVWYIWDGKSCHYADNETRFLTKELGVVYADEEDNQRKAAPVDKYKKMASRHPELFKKPWARWMMRHKFGREVMFFFFGKKRDKNKWPSHIAQKTDVERIQNCIWLLNDKQPFVATEKVDGSSFSAMAERGRFGKIKYYVCSRNVVFDDPGDKCFYDTNIYFEAWNKYNLKEIITKILNDYNLPNVAIQAEIYGNDVQKRDYSINEHHMAVFHIVSNCVKLPMDKVVEICDKYGLPHVPIVDNNYTFPDTIEELQEYVEGAPSQIDGLPREGIVFYDKATGAQYVKFVSPNFLLKYHG